MRRNESLLASQETATRAYEQQIDASAASYLRERGISKETALFYRLGLVREPEPGHEAYVGRIAIPYLSKAGVLSIKFRGIAGEDPKYLGLVGSKPRLFGVEAFFDPSPVIAITEGEFDAMVLWREVGIPAVGVPGVSMWAAGKHFPRCFAGYDQVLVFGDGDSPGLDFSKRVAGDLDQAQIVVCPDGTDVTDLFLREGAVGIRRRAGL